MKKIFTLLFLALFAAAFSALAKVPYDLKNGHMIDAKKLMYSFEYMERVYNSESEYEITANGQNIGFIRHGSVLYFSVDFNYVYLRKDGTFYNEEGLYFSEADCTGDMYMYHWVINENSFHMPKTLGAVAVYNEQVYYYKPGETNVYPFTPVSYMSHGSCVDSGRQEGLYYQAKPNNPAVTGIPSYPLPLPLVVEGAPQINIMTEE